MTGEVVPSLDTSGWVSGTAQKADKLIAYFLLSDYSQSDIYRGLVKSLPYLVHENGNQPTALTRKVQSAVVELFNPYFDAVDAFVTHEDIKDEKGNASAKYNVKLMVIVTEDGQKYSLGRLLNIVDGQVKAIFDINSV